MEMLAHTQRVDRVVVLALTHKRSSETWRPSGDILALDALVKPVLRPTAVHLNEGQRSISRILKHKFEQLPGHVWSLPRDMAQQPPSAPITQAGGRMQACAVH